MAVEEKTYLDLGGLERLWLRIKQRISALAATVIPLSEKGAAGGVASLTSEGKVYAAQIPEDVHDVVVLNGVEGIPSEGAVSGGLYYDPASGMIVSGMASSGDGGSAGGGRPSTTKLYVDRRDSRVYRWALNKGMVETGLRRPVKVSSEEEMERMIDEGEVVEGQMYYTMEE